MTIHVGSTYRVIRNLYFDLAPEIPNGTLCRVIGKAVYTDTAPHEEETTLEFENGAIVRTFFADEYLEKVE